jgi:hypothetical protein
MPSIAKRAIFATLGAITFGNAGTGSAAAADVPIPQAQVAPPAPGYYAPPPVAQGYAVPPPAYYPPPPPAYYAYAPAPVVVAPGPYYWGRRFYGPYGYVAHGYGRYERPWGHGYRRW